MDKIHYRFHNDNEEKRDSNLPSVLQPETPKEPMDFLSRSWSLSFDEISRALAKSPMPPTFKNPSMIPEPIIIQHMPYKIDAQIHSRKKGAIGRLFNHKESSNSNILKRKEKARMENARMHTLLSVAGLAAALATVTATENSGSKMSQAMASATELMASYCIEMGESAGASQDHLAAVVRSAVDVRRASDLVTLTAAAATALRGEAALKARLPKEAKKSAIISPCRKDIVVDAHSCASSLSEIEEEDPQCVGDLLQDSRKGVLRWRHVTVYINKKYEVIIRLKSKHVGGAFSKKNKSIVYEVIDEGATCSFIKEGNMELYFGVKTAQGIMEFKCQNKIHKKKWVDGIQRLLQRTS